MKKIVLMLFMAILPGLLFAAATSMNLSDALQKKLVTVEAVNTKGSYKGKAVKLTITNTSSSAIEIRVNLGIILKPENAAFQPMVLAGDEILALKAHAKGEVDVQVFCGDGPKACPIEGLRYTFLRVGGDNLIKVLQYIKDHDLYDHLGQTAVWAMTNYHSLNSVYDPKRDSVSRRLISHIVDVTKRDRPTFYNVAVENETPAQPAYIKKTDKIYVPFEVYLNASSVLTVGIFNKQGQWIKSVFERKPFARGKHNVMATLDPAELEAGKYSVRLINPEKTLQEKEITVEPW